MRMCYSVDFGPIGKLKLEGGSLRAIIRHNCWIPRPYGKVLHGIGSPVTEACLEAEARPDVPEAEMRWKENIDPLRICNDQIWFNPAYGHGNGGLVSPIDLSEALNAEPEKSVMDALNDLLGIESVNGVLRYGEGKGDCGGRRSKPDAIAKLKGRRQSRKAVRHDAVLAVDVIFQASPSFFFPKIREEKWTQEQIDKSLFWERGELDQVAVDAFREAGMARAEAVRRRKLEEEDARKARERREVAEQEAEDAEACRKNCEQNLADIDKKAMEKLKDIQAEVQRINDLQAKADVDARKAQEEGPKKEKEIGDAVQKAEFEAAEKLQTIGKAVKEAEARKTKAEFEASDAEKKAHEKLSNIEKSVQQAEGRKAVVEAEAKKAEDEYAEKKRNCEDAVKVVEQKKAIAERVASKAEQDAQRKNAWCKQVAEGETALERITKHLKKYPHEQREKIIQKVIESYASEVQVERKRADTADAFVQIMGEIGVFLLYLPPYIWNNFWNFLNECLPKFLPWVKE